MGCEREETSTATTTLANENIRHKNKSGIREMIIIMNIQKLNAREKKNALAARECIVKL